jgi:hypothetical protein
MPILGKIAFLFAAAPIANFSRTFMDMENSRNAETGGFVLVCVKRASTTIGEVRAATHLTRVANPIV